jgi:hypothetical protein
VVVPATCTDIKISNANPVLDVAAFFTDKTIWPFLFEQVLVTRFRFRELFVELKDSPPQAAGKALAVPFNFVFWKILGDREICQICLLYVV